MNNIITINNNTFEIRLAKLEDINEIQILNRKWTVKSLDFDNKNDGFLFCEEYKPEDLKKIIESKEIAVATTKNEVIAYYINDNHSHLLSQYESAIKQLIQDDIISENLRVSKRTQIVVEKDFHRLGLPSQMLKLLKPYLTIKYDLLFSIGINENPKRIAHEKAGWKIVYENDFNYYCIYKLNADK